MDALDQIRIHDIGSGECDEISRSFLDELVAMLGFNPSVGDEDAGIELAHVIQDCVPRHMG
jgi:hypothetical protein